ncbi:lytic transglycosylase domain-containing protein [Methylosinus sp. H3A]|uniref:lytic transglycosylase domain-containing protein n=1 Tax=Methylosinus sp. H3A TaxID=2785786 RepID=UPI0018C1F4E3|nr:lytic transglycosylase domain-containing protein [Methylosinus sp. H3A]MBG0809263.1 lytic transglycosylase domain-containing protein [Methylosinus sp. H3A]
MTNRQRGAARLVLLVAALGVAAALYPTTQRRIPDRESDDPSSPAAASSPQERSSPQEPWRPRDSAREALHDFVGPGAAPPDPRAATMLRRPAAGDAASKLLSYAPADGGLDFDAREPQPPEAAVLLGPDQEAFGRALAAYKSNDFAGGDLALAGVEAPLARAAAQWAGLRQHPREAGFARLSKFLAEHPDWPAAAWLRQRVEEALYGDKHPDRLIVDYFAERPPKTPAGRLALARVMVRRGEPLEVAALIKPMWREDDFNEQLEQAAKKEFSDYLDVADHKYRADRLLYAEKIGPALRIAAHAGKDTLDLARARALAINESASEKTFSALPAEAQKDPGLIFARIHMLRHQKKLVEAAALLRTAPRDPRLVVDGDAWWVERRLISRKLMDLGQFGEAYELCAQHSARSLSYRVEAEFHAGWIALRFLNDPAKAQRHFEEIARVAETPIQKSRGAYWLARAREAAGAAEAARASYENAALQSTTFYGQLARARLGAFDSPLRPTPEPARGDARDESVRAVELYFAAGEKELAGQLAADAARTLVGEAQLSALAEVAQRRREAKISLTLGKLASYRGIAIDDAAFPSFGIPSFAALPRSASRAIVYAIARQESAFDPKAVSSAGAMGLMQMIASTARHTAQQTGVVGFDLKRMLDEPAFNARLGAAHLGMLLDEHKGSYILAFAAYNAGGKRVKEWIDAYGDPRKTETDPIDWVERIPISETRNYVQRVIENLTVYRARFGDRETRAPQGDLWRMHAAN